MLTTSNWFSEFIETDQEKIKRESIAYNLAQRPLKKRNGSSKYGNVVTLSNYSSTLGVEIYEYWQKYTTYPSFYVQNWNNDWLSK